MTIVINGTVGAGGNNAKGDTREIQKLLNEIFPLHSLMVIAVRNQSGESSCFKNDLWRSRTVGLIRRSE